MSPGIETDAGIGCGDDPERPNRRFVLARDPACAPAGLARCVAAIGNFDGVHRGHAAVIARAQALALRLGKPCAVVTFEPHPFDVLAGRSVVFRLTPEPEKAAALARLGLDGMIVLTFDEKLAALSAEEFIAQILVQRLDVSAAVVGYDFHFGKGRTGSPAYLQEVGRRYGLTVEIVEKIEADVAGSLAAVHSTATRVALERGDVTEAARLLGHDWFVLREVVHGEKRGRTLGFPTANLRLDPSCRLRHGIYAVRVRIAGQTFGGVASFGRRPTFDDGAPLLEVFVFDFAGDLYGRSIEVSFLGWIRGEEKFGSVEALIAEMHRDVERAREILESSA